MAVMRKYGTLWKELLINLSTCVTFRRGEDDPFCLALGRSLGN
jgi:hypothetical protein